jgi:thiol-disulfide isomerase/thioredoxin
VLSTWLTPSVSAQHVGTVRLALEDALVRPTTHRLVPYRWPSEPEIVALYFGADWCAPCHEFVPKLREVYAQLRAIGASTDVVFVSLDRSGTDMLRYMLRQQMPWPGVDYRRLPSLPAIRALAGRAPPNLVLIDRRGRVLASAWAGDSYVGPAAVVVEWIRYFERRAVEDNPAR